MRNPILIGQAPGRRGSPEPLGGLCGRRLAGIFGMSAAEYARSFERVNLMKKYTGKKGKGDAFSNSQARHAACLLTDELARRPRLFAVAMGHQVGKALGLKGGYFKWGLVGYTPAFVMPHPSGVNAWWNDEANREKVKTFCRELLEEYEFK